MSMLMKYSTMIVSLLLLCAVSDQRVVIQSNEKELVKSIYDKTLLVENESAGLKGDLVYYVKKVVPNSPADRAGLLPNDLIFAVDDVSIYSEEQLEKTILQPTLSPGESYFVKFVRFNSKTGRMETMNETITAN